MADLDFGKIKIDKEDVDKAKESIAGLKDGIPSAESAIDSLAEAFLKVPGPLGLIVTGLAAVAGGLTLAALAAQEHIEQLNHLSESYGLTASQADLMQEATKRAGGSLEGVEAIYAKVAKAAYNANDPLKGTGAAFAELGISVTDSSGQLKSATDLTNEAVDAWTNGAQTTADFAAAQKILGKSFLEQLPALEAANEAKKMANELAEKGIFISKESVDATEKYSKATLETHGIMSAFGSQLVNLIMPQLTNLVTWFNKSAESGGIVRKAMDFLIDAMKELFVIGGAFAEIWVGITTVFDIVGKTIGQVAAAIDSLLHKDWSGAKNAILGIGDVFKESMDQGAKSIAEIEAWMTKVKDADTVGTQQTAGKSPFDNAGGEAKPTATKFQAAPNDPFEKYLQSLEKASENVQHLSEQEKAFNEILRIQGNIAEQNAKIDAENAANPNLHKQRIADITDEERAQIMLTASKIDAQRGENALRADYMATDKTIQSYINTIDKQINKGKQAADVIQLQTAVEKVHEDTLRQIADLEKLGGDRSKEKQELLDRETESVKRLTEAHQKLIESQQNWLSNGVQNYITSLGTIDQGFTKLTEKGISGFSDALTNLVVNGKNSFKQFIASMLEDIAKLIFQLLVVKPLIEAVASSFGGGGVIAGGAEVPSGATMAANGGVFTNGIQAFADGGIVNSPTLFGMQSGVGVMGEKGAEAIVPLSGGRAIPVQMKGGTQTGGVNNFNMSVSIGTVDSPERQAQTVQALQDMITKTVRKTMSNDMRRGNWANPVTVRG